VINFEVGIPKAIEQRIKKLVLVLVGVKINWLSGLGKV
jgi:hypothetical protein